MKDSFKKWANRTIDMTGHEEQLALSAWNAGQASADSRIAEQLETIKALNDCIGGKGSLTTDNLVLVGRLEHRIAELERELEFAKLILAERGLLGLLTP